MARFAWLLILLTAACAQVPEKPCPVCPPAKPAPERAQYVETSFAALPGWQSLSLEPSLRAFMAGGARFFRIGVRALRARELRERRYRACHRVLRADRARQPHAERVESFSDLRLAGRLDRGRPRCGGAGNAKCAPARARRGTAARP